MAVVERVKWNAEDSVLAWKFPSEELATWTQLIVAESQEAVLVHGGQMEGPFAAGRHTLTTENLPILRTLFGLPFGGRSPFSAEVWFVNRSVPLDVPWAITSPIQLRDPEYDVMLPVVASGQYGVAIEHTKRFLVQMVGTKTSFDRDKLQDYLRGVILSKAKDLISRSLVDDRISVLDLGAHVNDISAALKAGVEAEIEKYGLRLDSFYVTAINTLESDPAVQKLKMALADRAARKIQGYTYQQERSLDVLQSAAANEGTAGGVAGAGIGLGVGLGVAGAIGGAFSGLSKDLNASASEPSSSPNMKPDRLAMLKELGQMHKEGVLTAEEFAAEKARVLSTP